MGERILYLGLMGLSAGCFLAGLVRTVRRLRLRKDGALNPVLLGLSVYLLLATWCLRLAVGLYLTGQEAPGEPALSWWEQVGDSLLHSLQTFSMDEDYTAYVLAGKALLTELLPDRPLWAGVYGVYASVLNIMAPVAGGAILFDILTGIFPKLKLMLRPRKRQTYVFSELNDAALALAESIHQGAVAAGHKVTLIFTDAYANREEEASAERLGAATALGAICLREDLLELHNLRGATTSYILIDQEEDQNFHTLSVLASRHHQVPGMLQDARIYLFSQRDLAGTLVKGTVELLKEKLEPDHLPMIRVVRSTTNLVYHLLDQVPLFEPLVGRSPGSPLRMVILGSGTIGTEMFLATTWCAQMLDRPVEIHVLSQEEEADFCSRLDAISPEILEAGRPGSSLLQVYPGQSRCADPYFTFRYTQARLTPGRLQQLLDQGEPGRRLGDGDYFVVALGSDRGNLSMATAISQYLGRQALTEGARRAVVAYALFDHSLGSMMNAQGVQGQVLLHAFGSLERTYCLQNVFMTTMENAAYTLSQSYSKRDMDAFLKDEYGWRSNIARALHQKYKMFSAGIVVPGLFDWAMASREPWDPDQEEERQAREVYLQVLDGDPRMVDRLTWLEHRRWCAFLRAQGFRCPSRQELEAYAFRDGNNHKHPALRLHPCLVECDDLGIRPIDWENREPAGLDRLDALAHWRYRFTEGREQGEFKMWDRPCSWDREGHIRLN